MIITLHKFGAGWQRVDCGSLRRGHKVPTIQEEKRERGRRPGTQLMDTHPTEYELYYIPQWNS